jgi:hypothetical protein
VKKCTNDIKSICTPWSDLGKNNEVQLQNTINLFQNQNFTFKGELHYLNPISASPVVEFIRIFSG